MTKYTIGVYKAFKNSGNLRFPKKNTKKHWKHYFLEDELDDEDYTFNSEWVSSLKAMFLKRKQLYKKQFICLECGCAFTNYVKKNQDECDECPNCED